MQYFSILPMAILVTVVLIGGPLVLVAALRLFNHWYGNIRVRPVRSQAKEEDQAPLALTITWDPESRPYKVSRLRLDISEMVPGGRSASTSFTFEDKSAKKRSFVLPLKLEPATFELLTAPADPRTLRRTSIIVEVESVEGLTVRRKISKLAFMKALEEAPFEATQIEADALPAAQPDVWGVLTRIFPWRKVKEESTPAKKSVAKASGGATASAQIFDFVITKVWIEPGCIVCDACENEAPEVFHVLADTCIVRDNAPLKDTGSIVAAAEGCPVDVIKYDKSSA